MREALRVLAAQNLIRTAKGAGGGSFVTLPTVDHISTFLHANISLLSESEDVTLQEFLEARELLEVFAARQCAARRTQEDLDRLRATMVEDPAELGTSEHYILNKEFHSAVLDGCGNTLVCIAAQPVFSVLQTRLRREQMGRQLRPAPQRRPPGDPAAIEAGDSEAAGERDAQAHRLPQPHVPEDVARHARQSTSARRAAD